MLTGVSAQFSAQGTDISALDKLYIRLDGTSVTTGVVHFALGLSSDGKITSTVATGTVPFVVASQTVVKNLNVDLLDGLHASDIAVPTGSIMPYCGLSAPTGWLLCDGHQADRVTYANLFAVIAISTTGTVTNGSPIITGIPTTVNMEIGFPVSGDNIPAASKILTVDGVDQITLDKNATGNGVANIQVCPFGVGNGLTTFNVPDSAGRAPIGAGSGSGLTKRYVGTVLGEETHQLTVGELATHGHNWSPAQQFVTTVSRTLNAYGTIAGTQAVVVTVSSTSGSVNNVPTNGSNTAHNTMQPSFVTLFIIKT